MTLVTTPATAAEAIRGPGPYLAGGTALQLAWGGQEPEALTDISGLLEARGISLRGECLRIGALETLERCRTDPLVRQHAPLLAQACGVIGALGVRLLATLGGNIGWRFGDAIPALLALGAAVEADGAVQDLEDVLTLATMPLLTAVLIPVQTATCLFEKIGNRAAFSLSAATVAGWVDPAAGRVRLAGGAAGVPARRLRGAEALLAGGPPDWDRVAAAIGRDLDGAAGRLAGRVLTGLLRGALAA